MIGVCTRLGRLGISIQPAQPKKPTDKPTCERFFKTLREGLIQHLPAYKGPDIYSRGERVEDAAVLFVHELEDIIRVDRAGLPPVPPRRAGRAGMAAPEAIPERDVRDRGGPGRAAAHPGRARAGV